VSLIIADGILTPAQSVLGAIQGLTVVDPNIGSPTIVGVSCASLVLLFMVQPVGIQKLASCFAPIVILWLLFNASFGIYVSLDTLLIRGEPSDICIRTWLCMTGQSSRHFLLTLQVFTSCD
jgi:K+ transporter